MRGLTLCGLAVLLLGCATSQDVPVPPHAGQEVQRQAPAPVPLLSLNDWVSYFLHWRVAGVAEQMRERDELLKQINHTPSDALLLRHATLLLAAHPATKDYTSIQAALQAVQHGNGAANSPERQWAALMYAMAGDQRQLAEQGERYAQQLKDEQKRCDALKGKLDGLISIEQSLLQHSTEN